MVWCTIPLDSLENLSLGCQQHTGNINNIDTPGILLNYF